MRREGSSATSLPELLEKRTELRGSCLIETITNTIQRLDHVEFRVAGRELHAQPLDVAVDVSFVHIRQVVVGQFHQCMAALDRAGRLARANNKFSGGECYTVVFP